MLGGPKTDLNQNQTLNQDQSPNQNSKAPLKEAVLEELEAISLTTLQYAKKSAEEERSSAVGS